ncbi:acyltransferase [Peribacillus sp. TH24]|uniref:acyltransferase n=1 Tax=Peribacillus sp. TH24 TaxID=2798483 RepID=UPI00191153E2|nr:acyltransferase [Peribacillus sp. TH24]MBK5442691.1 acyltransferase [Peribacillus sp. TH24]
MSYLQNCSLYIQGNNNKITIGENVRVRQGDLYIEDDNNLIKIGNSTSIMGYTHIAVTEGKKAIIGEECMFSSDVVIRTGDSHSIIDNGGSRVNQARDVIIGDHVWLGNKTTILKGSTISSNSIVGTGSIVTKEFKKANVILVGNPAKIVRENTNWLKERI